MVVKADNALKNKSAEQAVLTDQRHLITLIKTPFV